MASVVEICNRALILLGSDTISSISEDTKPAKLCNIVYPQIRQDLIRSHPWNFAMKRTVLASTGTAPSFEYDYTFNLPSDCLRVWQVYDPDSSYKLEARTLVSNDDAIDLKYIADITDTTKWDSVFVSMVVYKLAIDICFGLTGSTTMIPVLTDQFNRLKAEAKLYDAQEESPDLFDRGSWLDSRD